MRAQRNARMKGQGAEGHHSAIVGGGCPAPTFVRFRQFRLTVGKGRERGPNKTAPGFQFVSYGVGLSSLRSDDAVGARYHLTALGDVSCIRALRRHPYRHAQHRHDRQVADAAPVVVHRLSSVRLVAIEANHERRRLADAQIPMPRGKYV